MAATFAREAWLALRTLGWALRHPFFAYAQWRYHEPYSTLRTRGVLPLLLLFCLMLPLVGMAQTPGNGATPAVPSASSWALLITLAVPMLLSLAKQEATKLPTWTLPVLAPALGLLGNWLATQAGLHGPGWVLAGVLGMAGVGLRELKDQLQQRITSGTTASSLQTSAPAPSAKAGFADRNLLAGIAILGLLVGTLLLGACGSLNRNLYNGETLAVDGVRGAVHTLNVWYQNATNQPGANVASLSNRVNGIYGDVRSFGVATATVDQLRVEYAANAANTNLTALQAGLTALTDQGSNIQWAVQALITGKP